MRLKLDVPRLAQAAWQMRIDMMESICRAGSGHPGGSLSIAEILSVLYMHEMNLDPANPQWEDRDRFVLSKGHAAPALYAALAARGYFSRDELGSLRQIDSMLQGHPDRIKVPGVDMSTGSLGQGISAACGMAYFAKDREKDYRVYCIVGDGELQEGQVWEAVMSAAHFGLDNLTVFLDNNNLQIDGSVDQVMSVYPLAQKFSAFGWSAQETDGHDVTAILDAVQKAKQTHGKPTVIICKTVKGKGVSFMENQCGWHGAPVSKEQGDIALKELRETLEKVRKGAEV